MKINIEPAVEGTEPHYVSSFSNVFKTLDAFIILFNYLNLLQSDSMLMLLLFKYTYLLTYLLVVVFFVVQTHSYIFIYFLFSYIFTFRPSGAGKYRNAVVCLCDVCLSVCTQNLLRLPLSF